MPGRHIQAAFRQANIKEGCDIAARCAAHKVGMWSEKFWLSKWRSRNVQIYNEIHSSDNDNR